MHTSGSATKLTKHNASQLTKKGSPGTKKNPLPKSKGK